MMAERNTAEYWVDWYLQNWVAWQHNSIGIDDSTTSQVAENYSSTIDFDEACHRMDKRVGAITDVVINDLEPAEKCAIHHAYLQAVYRFNRETLEMALSRAKLKVQVGLRRKGVWLGE